MPSEYMTDNLMQPSILHQANSSLYSFKYINTALIFIYFFYLKQDVKETV